MHKQTYGWKLIYDNAWYGAGRIDIERDLRLGLKECIPIRKSEARKYYFCDNKGRNIPSLQGIFAWQAYYFYHLNLICSLSAMYGRGI